MIFQQYFNVTIFFGFSLGRNCHEVRVTDEGVRVASGNLFAGKTLFSPKKG